MGLKLQVVTSRQGWTWLRDGLRLYFRRPLAFTGMLVVSLVGVMLLLSIPFIGGFAGFAVLPLMTLGFMAATRAALRNEPMGPQMFVTPLRTGAPGRAALLQLCIGYGVASVLTLLLSHWFDGGSFERLQNVMAHPDAPVQEVQAALADPRLVPGMLLRATLIVLVSVPYWHAPALVVWGGQSAGQALFSSTLALWRAKGAFFVYSLGWMLAVAAFGMVLAVVFSLLGLRHVVGLVGFPAGLIFSAAFYVSLWFTFVDCFGSDEVPPPST
ncbi:MAG: BPSS1780 family membrane protein [Burkholderiaceae bacterium]